MTSGPNTDTPDRRAPAPDAGGEDARGEFERLAAAETKYRFRLYVSGASPRSVLAITNVRRICDEYLPGHYELEVVDIYQQEALTREAQIIAVPTLVKEQPSPPRRFVGDMSDTEKIVQGLKLQRP